MQACHSLIISEMSIRTPSVVVGLINYAQPMLTLLWWLNTTLVLNIIGTYSNMSSLKVSHNSGSEF